jgi:hypothetical protein
VVRLLPFILIPVLILSGLGYWRYSVSKQKQVTPEITETNEPVEAPKTLPGASLEDRVKALEDLITKLATQLNALKNQTPQTTNTSVLDSRVVDLEASNTELKVRVSALEKGAPGEVSSSQPTIYIPMGATAGPIRYNEWTLLGEYETSIDPGNYPGYTGMSLEVNFRMVDPNDVGYIRLYNVTDSSVVSSELSTSSTSFGSKSTSSFKLASGQKTYKLQVKSTGAKDFYIQSARIKVNF